MSAAFPKLKREIACLSRLTHWEVKQRLDARPGVKIDWADYAEPINYNRLHPDVPHPRDTRKVLFAQAGDFGGNDWVLLVERHAGDFVYMSAWCDLTGFHCQSGTTIRRADDFKSMWNLDMDNKGRTLVAARVGFDVYEDA